MIFREKNGVAASTNPETPALPVPTSGTPRVFLLGENGGKQPLDYVEYDPVTKALRFTTHRIGTFILEE